MKKFIVSVGEVILRNIATKEVIAIGTTAVDTSFALTATKTDVRGGVGNGILFSYVSERSFDVTITQASFNKEVLALNAGSLIQTGTIEYLYTECVELDASGEATLTKVPIGNVTAIKPDDIKVTITPVGSTITIAGGANLAPVWVTYMTSGTAESVLIGSNTPPSMVELFYTTEVRDETNAVVELMQIYVPKFQLSGNYTMTFNANGVANEAIEGTAMLSSAGGCELSGIYARIAWLDVSGSTASSFSLIAATPSDWDFSAAALPQTKQIEVLGIPGDGIRANINITADCTFAIESGGDADITVSAGGLVTCANTATLADSAVVVVTHTATGITDRCIFNVVE